MTILNLCIYTILAFTTLINASELKIGETNFQFRFGETFAIKEILIKNTGSDVVYLEKVAPSCGGCTSIESYDQEIHPNKSGSIKIKVTTGNGTSVVHSEILLVSRIQKKEEQQLIRVVLRPDADISIVPTFVYWNKNEDLAEKSISLKFDTQDIKIHSIDSGKYFVWYFKQKDNLAVISVVPVSTENIIEEKITVNFNSNKFGLIKVKLQAFVK